MKKEDVMRIVQALGEKRYKLEWDNRKEEAKEYLRVSKLIQEIYEI